MAKYFEDYFNDVAGSEGVSFRKNATVKVGAVDAMVSPYERVEDNQNGATSTSHTIFVNDSVSGTFKVAAVSAVFGTASSSGTLQVEVATGTQAVASGTNQLTGTISLAGTANTVVTGTVIGTPTTITAGARINVILAGTLTSLANASFVVSLQRLS